MSPDQDAITVDNLMLADAARTFEGKLYVHGGGWNYLNVFAPGAIRPITLAGRVIVPWTSDEHEIILEILLEHRTGSDDPEQVPIVLMQLRPHHDEENAIALETATPFAFEIPGVGFQDPGEYAFVVRHAGTELARTRFQVNFPSDVSEIPPPDEA